MTWGWEGVEAMESSLDALAQQARDRARIAGSLPTYIPHLAQVDRQAFAAVWWPRDRTQRIWSTGAIHRPVPLMSVIKPFALAYLLHLGEGDRLRQWLGARPSKLPYHSLEQLRADGGTPRNSCLNSGAIALCAQLPGRGAVDRGDRFAHWLETQGGADVTVHLDHDTLASVQATPNSRNRAIAQTLAAAGHCPDPTAAIATYNRICCLAADAIALAHLGLQWIAPRRPFPQVADEAFLRTTLAMGGLYEDSPRFFQATGWYAKSGVSGLILAAHPHHGAIAVWSPPLDGHGHSLAGRWFLDQAIALMAP